MNEPTAADDVRQLKPGSICIYRDDFDVDLKSRPRRRPVLPRAVPEAGRAGVPARQDGQGVPRQAPQGRQHGLRGRASPRVCGIEMEAVEAGIRREFPGRKAKAAEINISAAAGRATTGPRRTCPTDLPYRVERMDVDRRTRS